MRFVTREKFTTYQADPNLEKFLAIPPLAEDGLTRARDQIRHRDYPRREMSELLYRYNREIGNDSLAMQNCESLNRPDSTCIFTGQQLGFMGGPSYTILKAISALLLARKANAIPIFWLATEDHDINEIDHVFALDSMGNLENFHLSFSKGVMVEDLRLTARHIEEINRFIFKMGLKNRFGQFAAALGDRYADAMIRILVELFKGTGLVFLEPRLLRPYGLRFFEKEIVHSDEITALLQGTAGRLSQAGGNPTISTGEGTNLFLKVEGRYRKKIHKVGLDFFVGDKRYDKEALVKLLECEPESFSVNVAARPVLQSLLFPTLAYAAGPGELKYYHQLLDYHHYHGVPMPWIIPRISATILTPQMVEYLRKCDLQPWDPIPENWLEFMPEIEEEMLVLTEGWNEVAQGQFGEDIAPDSLRTLVRQGAKSLQMRVIRNRLEKKGIPGNALHILGNGIFPHHKPQERVLNWLALQGQIDENLLQEFLSHVDWKPIGHLYCYC